MTHNGHRKLESREDAIGTKGIKLLPPLSLNAGSNLGGVAGVYDLVQ